MSQWIDQEAREHQAKMEAKRQALNGYKSNDVQRQPASLYESEQTEKTLHHLAGRVEELRARLERVLIPAEATGNPLTVKGEANTAGSQLTERLRSFRRLAQNSIDTVEDILNRLDA